MAGSKANETEDKVDAAIAAANASGFNNGMAYIVRTYRGVRYRMEELELGEYEDLVAQATSQHTLPDGTTEDRLDRRLLDRLVLRKAIKEPADFTTRGKGVRLIAQLQVDVNRLNFGEETDETKAAKSGDSDAEESTGNG